jgi:hypothetical protein
LAARLRFAEVPVLPAGLDFAPNTVGAVLSRFRADGFAQTAVVGALIAGPVRVSVA